ncbi:HNH endonuclease family protein [Corynebacterium sp. P7202]|uniref:HNH endonuclease family protein n=1 Tax=Corynebacterium pygosceleis TaxID=2800406 RepID=A0A9Q4C8C4_9CORY|nr:HNH endonuclease family protein [Corynebacterium pygosceleis]MCK7637871.1 HNH endonuclease family protein [Corynebacterium pygosceleis]MCX7444589.1 HNH endonuclease family protein [Corynebacterium pygosceleis]MCX7468587.1 HNH endonuclease family protein [Corynebacterium pygosceleis]
MNIPEPRRRGFIPVAAVAVFLVTGAIVLVSALWGAVEDARGGGSGGSGAVTAAGEPDSGEWPGPQLYRDMLAELDVRERAPLTGYAREAFGQRWSDDVEVEFGHNGCDTRNDILARDLIRVEFRPGTRDCVVQSGLLNDYYTGTQIDFVRGPNTSNAVQVDHIVPLADAWMKGAQDLDPELRRAFANDPDNLITVSGPMNQEKGAADAATWLPPNPDFRCEYVKRQITVKHRYHLWVTPAERDALTAQLSACG